LAAPIAGQKQSPLVWRSTQGWAEGFFLAAAKRAGQALEARLFIDRLLDEDAGGLVAICGDLNADGGEVPVRLLLGSRDDTNNETLTARALTALELSLPPARRYSVLHAGRRVMLDHVLTSAALTAALSGIEIHNEGLADEVLSHPETRRPAESFHAPVVAEFHLPKLREAQK
jgi:predicted extracellular nuclease